MRIRNMRTSIIATGAALFSAATFFACTSGETAEARSANTSTSVANVAAETALPTQSKAALRYVTAPVGNAARYRIREQLVGLDLPNDAVGETSGVTGVIAADAKGNVIPSESKFTIDVSTLKSDKDRRDGFVRGRVLETKEFPTVTFVPTSVRGVSMPLPKSGTKTFDLIGDLTVRGTTKPTVWKVTAQFAPDGVKGAAHTAFTFTDFAINQPRVPVVLSVADTIKLEMDFNMVPEGARK